MSKPYVTLIGFFLLFAVSGFSQNEESNPDEGFVNGDSTIRTVKPTEEQVYEYLHMINKGGNSGIAGGYVESIFHEIIDSAVIKIAIEGTEEHNLVTDKGLFNFSHSFQGKLVDIQISHPDYHVFDTAFILPDDEYSISYFQLTPKYRILLRGRVFAGKMPLEGVDVNVQFEGNDFYIQTLGCYYDNEDYWNCLFDGMFKKDLIADYATDSIHISLEKDGMQSLSHTMRFDDYNGEIIDFKMKYATTLPFVPINSLSLQLGFPFLSTDNDWFVSLSYYRLLNTGNLRRFGVGVEADMYLSTITSTYGTLQGRDPASYDSSYVFSFLGPSVLMWVIKPEQRYFSTYIGCTFAFKIDKGDFVPTPFLGSRIFLDRNKALNIEFRYAEFYSDVIRYTFNPYGNPDRYSETNLFRKFTFTIGVQVAFQ